MATPRIHKTVLGEFPIIHQSDNLSIIPIKIEEPSPGIEFFPHHNGPYANTHLTEAINALNQKIEAVTPKKFGPAIGSEGFYGIPNHEPGSPRK